MVKPIEAIANYTTGPASLPDVGQLAYNGCLFSPLYETNLSGKFVKDAAGRTVKYTSWLLTADGYVTLPAGAADTAATMATLYRLLSAQGGALTYQGRGFDLVVNAAGGPTLDAAWGPVPEILEFQPLGGGLSAKIKWQVTVNIPPQRADGGKGPVGRRRGLPNNVANGPLLQLNYETTVSYGEDGFSTISIGGTLEIAMTRTPLQTTRTLTTTVDDFRSRIEAITGPGIDLDRFKVNHREIRVSRDKRTMEWSFEAEERPYMDSPPDCVARGTFGFKPASSGMGLVKWLCTLRMTYVVRNDRPRRVAYFAFLALLRWRMNQSKRAKTGSARGDEWASPPYQNAADVSNAFWTKYVVAETVEIKKLQGDMQGWLLDFSGEEGVGGDSKTVSFSASWRVISSLQNILLASGMWKKVAEKDAQGNNLWATSMRGVQGSRSWLPNKLDPALDVVVDFGGP